MCVMKHDVLLACRLNFRDTQLAGELVNYNRHRRILSGHRLCPDKTYAECLLGRVDHTLRDYLG